MPPRGRTCGSWSSAGSRGLALLSAANRALFDPGAAAGGCAWRGVCCAFSAFQLCQAWWQETEPRDVARSSPRPQGRDGQPLGSVSTPCAGCPQAGKGVWILGDGGGAPRPVLFDAFPPHTPAGDVPSVCSGTCLISIPCRGTPGGSGNEVGMGESSRSQPERTRLSFCGVW